MRDNEARQGEAHSLLWKLWWLLLDRLIAILEAPPVRAQYLALALAFLKHNNIKAENQSAHSAKGGLEKLQAAMLAEFPSGPGKKQ